MQFTDGEAGYLLAAAPGERAAALNNMASSLGAHAHSFVVQPRAGWLASGRGMITKTSPAGASEMPAGPAEAGTWGMEDEREHADGWQHLQQALAQQQRAGACRAQGLTIGITVAVAVDGGDRCGGWRTHPSRHEQLGWLGVGGAAL